ncbi:THAP-type domain-containing protein [Aphis craccivora]|uniref:THAP-type domain-containing protein n=1 Tax=Aphis craccivora TaxID=307492 RepID=A0A6G0YH64_APHCR|nr:THAP-type domain-containing protein [Aphis craccivora]
MFTEFKPFSSDLTMTQQKKCHKFCFVFGCNSRYSTCEGISFHQFPKENEIKVIHFTEDYFCPSSIKAERIPEKNAVPNNMYLPKSAKSSVPFISPKKRLSSRNIASPQK